jgi:N-acetylmuramoyl-L-alanine amidase
MRFPVNLPLAILTIAALISSISPSFAQNSQSAQAGQMAQMENSSPPDSKHSSLPFSDIDQNVYKPEILEAVQLKIVQGFPDGTFRPNQPITREQAVSMIVDAINIVTPVDLNAQPTRRTRPFLDVPSDRWSAAKINWAQWNIWPAGTPTGKFRPTDNITRTDLVAFLRRAAERIKVNLGRSSALTPTQEPIKFSDVSGFDKQLTLQMSAYCRVASPLNEKGNKFAPTQPAHRDYTTAALVRMLNCVKKDTK